MKGKAPELRHSRLYGLLLRTFLTRRLASRYGVQMQDTFALLRQEARARGGHAGLLAVWLRELHQLRIVTMKISRPESSVRVARPRRSGPKVATWLDAGGNNVRQALRAFRRSPGFTATVVLTLALGIGANATVFGVIDRLLLQPPDHILDPDAVVRILVVRRYVGRQVTTRAISYPDFRDFDVAQSLAATAVYQNRQVTFGHGAGAARLTVATTSPSFFPLLGVRPHLGRFYEDEDDVAGAAALTVLGYEFWRRQFGADREVLGRTLQLGGAPHRILGVAPEGFTGVNLQRVDAWVPLRSPANSPSEQWETGRGYHWISAIARLADGVAVEAAEDEATTLHRAGRADHRGYDPEASVTLGSLIAARGGQRSDESVVARWLAGVSAVVLLIACANVANLLLARAIRNRRETSIRVALGISRRRLAAQQLTQSVLLAGGGGLAALALSYWGGQLMRAVLLPNIHWARPPVDTRVLVFTFGAALIAGVLVGLLPALQSGRHDITGALKGDSRSGVRYRVSSRLALLVVQAALSVVLLVGAGLFVKSLSRLTAFDLGIDMDSVIAAFPEIDDERLPDEERTRFFAEAAERLAAMDAVENVSVAAAAPYYLSLGVAVEIPGRDELPQFSTGGPYIYPVTTDHFATAGIQILRGRGFTTDDAPGSAPVVVVNETLARAYWPGVDSLGECMIIGRFGERCFTVVGVAKDFVRWGQQEEPSAQFFISSLQFPEAFSPRAIFVRAQPEAIPALTAAVRREIEAVSDAVRFVRVQRYSDLLGPERRSWELGATMFSAFGTLALIIAAVGLYGVLAFNVAQRTHEIGVRSALGASRAGLVGMVVGQAVRLIVFGLLVGVGLSLAAGRFVEPLLFEVQPSDPTVILVVTGLLGLVALMASMVPALRASRVDPLVALRSE